jgi:RNA polymerase sigma-70 factor, ECF subfamily
VALLVTESPTTGDKHPVTIALVPRPVTPDAVPTSGADWAAFYDANVAFVWRSLRRLGVHPSNLDDAAQEVFLVAFQRNADFEGRSTLRTWLYGIAFNIAQRFARGARRSAAEPVVEEELADPSGLLQEEALARAQAVALLYTVLDQLDGERRAVFVLAELEQLSAPEIAEVTSSPLNTVYSRLRSARRDFDAALRRLRAHQTWRQR